MWMLLLTGCVDWLQSEPPLTEFVDDLRAQTGTKLILDACAHEPDGIEARCTMVGREADAEALVDTLRDKPISGTVPGSKCQEVGYMDGWSVDPSHLPETTLKVRRVFRHLGRVCIDMDVVGH